MGFLSARSIADLLAKSFLQRTPATRRLRALLFLAITLPIVALAAFSYTRIDRELAQSSFLRRQAVANLAATALRAKFDTATESLSLLTSDGKFHDEIEAGKWQEALDAIVPLLPQKNQTLDQISLTDANGLERATSAVSTDAAKNRDHGQDDWFTAAKSASGPYVSNIIMEVGAEARAETLVVVPVYGSSGDLEAMVVGHLPFATLISWARAIDAGPQATVLFADRHGRSIIESRSRQGEYVMADLSAFAPVEKSLKYFRGVEIVFDPMTSEQAVAAYEPVLRYGWSVVVDQPLDAAFALRSSESAFLLWFYGVVFLMNVLLGLLIMASLNSVASASRREKTIFESVADGLVVIDRHARIINMNGAAETIFGWKRSDALGKNFDDVFVATDDKGRPISREQLPIWQALSGHKVSAKFGHLRKDGTVFPASVLASPLHGDDGATGAVLIYRDISKEEELDRAKREFISVASHQLLTPVSAVKGFLSLILEGDFGPVTDKQKEYLDKLYHLNERMIELVEDLLNVSRIDMGVFEALVEPVDMKAFIGGEVDAVRPIAATKGVRVEEQYGSQTLTLRISPKLLRSVVQNLLSNAIKYTPEGGQVGVTLERTTQDEKDGILLSVRDTGYGIPESAKAKIFSKFFRADNVRIMGTEGTGLGLYIVRSVMNLVRGKIWFESEEGRGTTFFAFFPAKAQTAPEHLDSAKKV